MPGVHGEQTPLLLQAGVVQSNLIRWRDGVPEKFGGWQKFFYAAPGPPPANISPPPLPGPIRELWPWADFSSVLRLAAGGDQGLFLIQNGAASNITPSGWASSTDWCLVNFGEDLIAQPEGGPLFDWVASTGGAAATQITAAPLCTGFFLAMPQQQLVAYGATTGTTGVQDPMLIRWSDNANYNTWVAAVNNQAGSFRLARGSKIVGGMQVPMQAMLWTDIGLWFMTYIGYPDVWGFSEVAQECGLIAKKAVGVCGTQVFWMSRDKFWTFSNGQVAPLPCEIWDVIFQNLNPALVHKIRCGTNAGFDEVMWFYPSLATVPLTAVQENNSYVKFNRVTGEWDYGTTIDVFGGAAIGGIPVSDWIDTNVFGHPISAMTLPDGRTSQLMWMETGRDADVQPMHWWFRTGLFTLTEGEDFLFIDRCRPDFRWREFSDSQQAVSAQVKVTIYTQDDPDNPQNPPIAFGPFACSANTGQFDPRARGRYFSLKVEGNDLGSFVRLGAIKFRYCPDGRAG